MPYRSAQSTRTTGGLQCSLPPRTARQRRCSSSSTRGPTHVCARAHLGSAECGHPRSLATGATSALYPSSRKPSEPAAHRSSGGTLLVRATASGPSPARPATPHAMPEQTDHGMPPPRPAASAARRHPASGNTKLQRYRPFEQDGTSSSSARRSPGSSTGASTRKTTQRRHRCLLTAWWRSRRARRGCPRGSPTRCTRRANRRWAPASSSGSYETDGRSTV